ncbi:MAG: hypothetical protein ABH859_08210 [Pseudomonadota bacterium]
MRKLVMLAVCLAVGLCFSATGKAGDEVTIKAKSKTVGDTTKEKMEVKTPEGKEVVKVKETATDTEAKIVTKTPKAGHVKKEVVTFKEYNQNADTITVITDTKEVRTIKNGGYKYEPGIVKQHQKVTITSTYDPKLLDYVVTDMAPQS